MLKNGLERGLVRPYDAADLEKFRETYYGGLPASIILLSDGLCNGFCYDRSTLLAMAFLDEENVQMVYADIDNLRLNPEYADNPQLWDHCFLERKLQNGTSVIYDPAYGLVFEKSYYWKLERPKVRLINKRDKISDFSETMDRIKDQIPETDKYSSLLILPLLEKTFDDPNETYASKGIKMLQREIALFKEKIGYDELWDQTRRGLKIEPVHEKRFIIESMNSTNKRD